MTTTIWIPGTLPTENTKLSARGRVSSRKRGNRRWNNYAALKRDADLLVAIAARAKQTVARRVDVELEWHRPNRRTDPDNVLGGLKFVMDGLVKAGVLPDDSPRWVGNINNRFIYPGELEYRGPGVLVRLIPRKGEDADVSKRKRTGKRTS